MSAIIIRATESMLRRLLNHLIAELEKIKIILCFMNKVFVDEGLVYVSLWLLALFLPFLLTFILL